MTDRYNDLIKRLLDPFDMPRDMETMVEASDAIRELIDLLERFRDFVANNGGVKESVTSRLEPTNHHNPIWVEIAEAIEKGRNPSPSA